MLLYGHVDLELAEQIHGLPKAWGPMPFKKTTQTPSHGTPAASDDITGGIGWEGLAQIQKFVESGGLLVTLGSGTMLALEGGIVRGVRRDSGGVPRSAGGGGAESAQAARGIGHAHAGLARARDLRAARSSDRVRLSRAHARLPPELSALRRAAPLAAHGLLHDLPRRAARSGAASSCSGAIAGTDAPFVVSGQVWGESNLIGRPAILDMPVGRGRVVAFNFNPLHRDLNRGDQRLLWNAILNWEAILAAARARAIRYDSAMNEQKSRRGQWISGLLFVLIAAIAIGAILLQLSVSRH